MSYFTDSHGSGRVRCDECQKEIPKGKVYKAAPAHYEHYCLECFDPEVHQLYDEQFQDRVASIITAMVKVANNLDKMNLYKEADEVTDVMKKIADYYNESPERPTFTIEWIYAGDSRADFDERTIEFKDEKEEEEWLKHYSPGRAGYYLVERVPEGNNKVIQFLSEDKDEAWRTAKEICDRSGWKLVKIKGASGLKLAQDIKSDKLWLHLINEVGNDLWRIVKKLSTDYYWMDSEYMRSAAQSLRRYTEAIKKHTVLYDELKDADRIAEVVLGMFISDETARKVEKDIMRRLRERAERAYRDVQNLYGKLAEDEGMITKPSLQFSEEKESSDRYIAEVGRTWKEPEKYDQI